MTNWNRWLIASALAVLGGCPAGVDERNAFLRYTEDFGRSSTSDSDTGSGTGTDTAGAFRPTMTITMTNSYTPIFTAARGDLNVNVAAWVNVSSIRTAEQQDALFAGGYVQLTREVRLGSVFTLPPGTFVFNGPGLAGATPIVIPSPTAAGQSTTATLQLITPDVLLFFKAPPVSCETPAFTFTDQGFPLDADTQGVFIPGATDLITANTSATDALGIHTLAQIDVYQCSPLRPGLFLKIGGGVPQPNEFFEGDNITIDFRSEPDANRNYASVTRG